MTQPTLFDPLPARLPAFVRGSHTSKEAARTIRPDTARLRRIVLAFIVSRGADGATQKEASIALGIPRATLCPRFRELEGWQDYPVQIRKTVQRRDGCFAYVAL